MGTTEETFARARPGGHPEGLLLLLALLLTTSSADAAMAFQHGWSTVADVMAMHGKYPAQLLPSQADIEFAASNYAMVTTGTGCRPGVVNASRGHTIEDSVLSVLSRIKAANPHTKTGMYWRSDFALELADCSGFSDEWNAHAHEWSLKDDSGKIITSKAYIDYLNPNASAFFAKVLVNVTKAKMPNSEPIVDYIYIDGDPGESSAQRFKPGINDPVRSAKLVEAVYATFGSIQEQLDEAGDGQKIICNGMDTEWTASKQISVARAPAMMFDHFSILQFLDRTTGAFNAPLMDQAFDLIQNKTNVTVQVKGWPGPIVKQRDTYPSSMQSPSKPSDFRRIALERFNSELALFLLAADANDFWVYSWFWGWDDYLPGHPDSTVPDTFFPQARCPLGPPKGPMKRLKRLRGGGNTYQYTRQFASASVFVDLENRTASRVDFAKC